MAIQQISVFLENRPGSLLEILELLAGQGVDLRAYSMAETSDYGIMRLVARDAEAAAAALKAAGFTAKVTPVLGVLVDDRPGASVKPFHALLEAGVSVEYSYAYAMGDGRAMLLLRVDDYDKAQQALLVAGAALARHTEMF